MSRSATIVVGSDTAKSYIKAAPICSLTSSGESNGHTGKGTGVAVVRKSQWYSGEKPLLQFSTNAHGIAHHCASTSCFTMQICRRHRDRSKGMFMSHVIRDPQIWEVQAEKSWAARSMSIEHHFKGVVELKNYDRRIPKLTGLLGGTSASKTWHCFKQHLQFLFSLPTEPHHDHCCCAEQLQLCSYMSVQFNNITSNALFLLP